MSKRKQAPSGQQLREEPAAPGSHYHVLVCDGVPSVEQRVEMAKRVQQHDGRGAYVQIRQAAEQAVPQEAQQLEEQVMQKAKGPGALPAGVDVKEIEQAQAQLVKDQAAKEAQQAKDVKAKAKADDKARKATAEARKTDVTPDPAKHLSPEKQAALKEATKKGGKPAKPASAKAAPKAAPAKAVSKGGRPARSEDPDQKYRVVKDNTRSGHMKVFMAKAAELKTFKRAELVSATKSKVTADRAERYFDYCLYKKLIGEAA